MARIDHGMEEPLRRPNTMLRFGIFLSFLGVGFLFAYLITEFFHVDPIMIPGFLLLFGGMGLITAHYMDKRENG